MCGIAGIVNFTDRITSPFVIQRMTDSMAHRGPDAGSFFSEGKIALGHRRLSIIDLSEAANQPFIDNSGRYVMVFNGEMYNYEEVKSLLPEYSFKTSGDSEVLLAAFIKWGPECISYFKGMFAFAIWDKNENELTIMRDRLGVKPLYYFINDENFLFASEIRSILASRLVERRVSDAALLEYFSYQSVGFPLAIVEDIHQVKAGSYIKVKNGKLEKKIYWSLTQPKNVEFDFNQVTAVQKNIRSLLTQAVERRLVSDVPVGAFLSGGIDSSTIVGLMAEVSNASPNTFNITFGEKDFDEDKYADIIAKKFNTRHTKIQLQSTIFLEELENALNAMDTPSGDGINTFVVSKAIRRSGITVALSGIGGDELFAGYPFFLTYLQLQKRKSLFKGTGLLRRSAAHVFAGSSSNKKQRVGQILSAETPAIENVYPAFRQILSPSLIRKLTSLDDSKCTALSYQLQQEKMSLKQLPLLSQVSVAEYLGYTQQTLLKDTDQMSMAVSLEVREPFFDHELLEFVLSIPDSIKYPVYSKSLLVESLKPLLPDEIVHRKKQGFLFPWHVWMKRELKLFCEARIQQIAQRSFINEQELLKYWQRFLKNDPAVRWSEIWLFVVLEHWMNKNNVN